MHETRSEADSGDGLPFDPDVDAYGLDADDADVTSATPANETQRPLHLRWRSVALVALGGAFGTAAREGVSLALPSAGAGSAATLAPIFLVNVTGAFMLGLLLEVLLRHGPDGGLRRSLRLMVGTGFLGGYTTYSTLAVGAGQALDAGAPVLGLLYATGSIIIGSAAALAGVAIASAVHPRPRSSPGEGR